MTRKESPGSRLEVLWQNESCLLFQVLCGVSGKTVCVNPCKRGFCEIKKVKKP